MWVNPRLCRGDSQSLTIPEIHENHPLVNRLTLPMRKVLRLFPVRNEVVLLSLNIKSTAKIKVLRKRFIEYNFTYLLNRFLFSRGNYGEGFLLKKKETLSLLWWWLKRETV